MCILRQILEMLYFISGITIAIFGIYAIKQFRVAKEQLIQAKQGMRISSMRDAMKLTAEQCDRFAKELIPRTRELSDKIKELNIDLLLKSKYTLEEKSIKVDFVKNEKDHDKIEQLSLTISDLANAYEVIALYFENGITVDDIAFRCIGKAYCNGIETLLPLMVMNNETGENNAALDLFIRWQNRINLEMLQRKQHDIEKQIEKSAIHVVKTIGSE